jgi:hypothetical protein
MKGDFMKLRIKEWTKVTYSKSKKHTEKILLGSGKLCIRPL